MAHVTCTRPVSATSAAWDSLQIRKLLRHTGVPALSPEEHCGVPGMLPERDPPLFPAQRGLAPSGPRPSFAQWLVRLNKATAYRLDSVKYLNYLVASLSFTGEKGQSAWNYLVKGRAWLGWLLPFLLCCHSVGFFLSMAVLWRKQRATCCDSPVSYRLLF